MSVITANYPTIARAYSMRVCLRLPMLIADAQDLLKDKYMDVYAHMYMHICVTCVACVTLPEAYSSFGAEAGWRRATSRVRVVLQLVLSHSTIPPFLTASVAARIWDTPSAKRGGWEVGTGCAPLSVCFLGGRAPRVPAASWRARQHP